MEWGPSHLADGTPYGTLHEVNCKEEFSLAYAHAIASAGRCTLTNIRVDVERVDFTVRQVADHDMYDDSAIDVQMKCTSQDVLHADGVHWQLEAAHYDSLRSTRSIHKKILVVLLVPPDLESWLDHSTERSILRRSAYWVSLRDQPATTGGSKTVTLPSDNLFDVPNLLRIMKRVGDGGDP